MRNKFFICLLLVFASFNVLAKDKVLDIQHWKTSNGARVFFVAAPELPILDVVVSFDAGSARDQSQYGLALLTNAMLTRGAGKLNADQIAEQIEDTGAQIGTGVSEDNASISLRTLTDNKTMEPALNLFTTIIADPTFPKSSFAGEKKRLLAGLEKQKQSPGAIAKKAFLKSLYNDHPYATTASGTEKTVKNINRENLNGFYQQHYVANNAIIVIVGDVTKEKANAISERVINKLPAGKKPPALPVVKEIQKAAATKIDFPSTQTHLLIGQIGIKRGDQDYFPLLVANEALGGNALVSRLGEEVRQKRGLSYSIYSYFDPMHQNGPFAIALQTKTDQTDQALDLVNKILTEYVKNGPTKKELNTIQNSITGSFPLRFKSNAAIASNVMMIAMYDLPLDYLDNFRANIKAVTLEQIKDALKRRLHPDRMVTIRVGGKLSSQTTAETQRRL